MVLYQIVKKHYLEDHTLLLRSPALFMFKLPQKQFAPQNFQNHQMDYLHQIRLRTPLAGIIDPVGKVCLS